MPQPKIMLQRGGVNAAGMRQVHTAAVAEGGERSCAVPWDTFAAALGYALSLAKRYGLFVEISPSVIDDAVLSGQVIVEPNPPEIEF